MINMKHLTKISKIAYATRSKSVHSLHPEGLLFDRELKMRQKDYTSAFKGSRQHIAFYDFPLFTLLQRMPGIRREYSEVAFIGTNPLFFLRNYPQWETKTLYYCENSQKGLDKSTELINKYISSNPNVRLPKLVPTLIDEENFSFEKESLNMIVSNMSLHWVNKIEKTFSTFYDCLAPDGTFMASLAGGDTLQELRICMSLAEQEREGGVSSNTSPFVTVTDIGNLFARFFKMPTIDLTRTQFEFTNFFKLLEFLQITGETNALYDRRKSKNPETFNAASALYQTLFNKMTIGQRDEFSTSVLVDTMRDDYSFMSEEKEDIEREMNAYGINRDKNIIASFDFIFLIGWKQHEGQQKAKTRGTANFSLKDLAKDMNNEDVKYGNIVVSDDEDVKK